MDFNFKKARNTKRREDKARSAHHSYPGPKHHTSNHNPRQHNDQKSGIEAHSGTTEKPVLQTETDCVVSQQEAENNTPVKDTKSYSRRSVVSNWQRYELPADNPEERPEGALDFETVINSLPDVKGHLKLSHEQSWGDERSELQEIFFNIDMHQMFTSLERIPFHVRQNMPPSIFTPEQLSVFEQDADDALKQSCALKVTSKEDSCIRQKIPVIPANELDLNKTTVSPVLSKSAGRSDTTTNETLGKLSSFLETNDTNTSPFNKEAEITPTSKKLSLSDKPAASSKNDELDLDFLLSLDAAVPDTPKHQGGALGINPVTDSKPTEKFDDWLDNLLDD